MHEPNRFSCVFGCRQHPDALRHYLECHILWSILSDAFEELVPPLAVGRLDFFEPAPAKLKVLQAAFDTYHLLKVGLRHVVFRSQQTQRFSEIIDIATRCIFEHKDNKANTRNPSRLQTNSSTTYDNQNSSDGDLRVHAEVPDYISDESDHDLLFDDWALPNSMSNLCCLACPAQPGPHDGHTSS